MRNYWLLSALRHWLTLGRVDIGRRETLEVRTGSDQSFESQAGASRMSYVKENLDALSEPTDFQDHSPLLYAYSTLR